MRDDQEGMPDCAEEHGVTYDGQRQAICASPILHAAQVKRSRTRRPTYADQDPVYR